jgi:hypothetical protein
MSKTYQTFTKENCDELKSICEKIISLLDENIDGALMMSQQMMLAKKLTEFGNTPIVKDSGIISTINQ